MMRHLLEDCRAQRVFFVGGVRNEHRYAGPLQGLSRLAAARPASSSTRTTSTIWITRTNRRIGWRWTRLASGPGRTTTCLRPTTKWRPASSPGRSPAAFRVPRDLGVVGFDDTRVAQMTNPPLTTVRVPMSKMGATAIELLCQRIAEPSRPAAKVSLVGGTGRAGVVRLCTL